MNYLLLILVALGGAGLSAQAAINAELRAQIGHALPTAVISFAVGLVGLLLAIPLIGALPSTSGLKSVPWWGWTGGLFGAFFIVVSAYAVRSLGATLFFALVITSQLLAAVVIDHYGLFGMTKDPWSISRLLGLALLITGAVLIKFR